MLPHNTPAGTAVNVNIIVTGQRVAIAGITTGPIYVADRINRNTGAAIATDYVEVCTWHDVPAAQSRSGEARTYYRHGRQSVAFTTLRAEPCPQLDELTADELFAAVERSLAEVQSQSLRIRAALIDSAADAAPTKAVFSGTQQSLALAPTK